MAADATTDLAARFGGNGYVSRVLPTLPSRPARRPDASGSPARKPRFPRSVRRCFSPSGHRPLRS